MKGVMRFGKRVKLSPLYIGPFKILARLRLVAYSLTVPINLYSVYPGSHVSMLKTYHGGGDYIIK